MLLEIPQSPAQSNILKNYPSQSIFIVPADWDICVAQTSPVQQQALAILSLWPYMHHSHQDVKAALNTLIRKAQVQILDQQLNIPTHQDDQALREWLKKAYHQPTPTHLSM